MDGPDAHDTIIMKSETGEIEIGDGVALWSHFCTKWSTKNDATKDADVGLLLEDFLTMPMISPYPSSADSNESISDPDKWRGTLTSIEKKRGFAYQEEN